MNTKKEKLNSLFDSLTEENKSFILCEAIIAYKAEQAVKRQYGLDKKPPAPQDRQPA
jgi:hypothetical protein